MSNGALDPLYKDLKTALWVEDQLTRDYLTAVGDGNPAIRLLIAGSSAHVDALVASARKEKFPFVFGLSDRDFGATNYGKWSASTQVFRLQMHEIENALLDPAAISSAMAGLGKHLDAAAVRKKLEAEAKTFTWGMALGATMAWVRTSIDQDFPSSSGLVNVADQASALDRIVLSPWWQTHLPALPTTLTKATLSKTLASTHATYQSHLASDQFLSTFAGKELLGRVFSWLAQGGKGPTPTLYDLAKAIGNAQRLAGSVPAQVADLLNILKGI